MMHFCVGKHKHTHTHKAMAKLTIENLKSFLIIYMKKLSHLKIEMRVARVAGGQQWAKTPE